MFGLAWAFVAHTDSHFDTEMLCRFVHAYQEVQPLTIGELWAITLRIVLIENLRRLAELIVHSSEARQEADGLADRLLGAGGRTAESWSVVLGRHEGTTVPDAFAVQFVHRLREQDPRITPALTWLDQNLAARGTTADAVVRDEHQRQGAGAVTVRNIITSMRVISDVDWNELFERISLVDDMLSAASLFRDMDFPASRNVQTYCMNNGSSAGDFQYRCQYRRDPDRHIPMRSTVDPRVIEVLPFERDDCVGSRASGGYTGLIACCGTADRVMRRRES